MAVPRLKFFAVACEEQASSGGAAIVLVETSFMSKVGLGIRTQLDNEHGIIQEPTLFHYTDISSKQLFFKKLLLAR